MPTEQTLIKRKSGEMKPAKYHTQLTMQEIIRVVDSRIEIYKEKVIENLDEDILSVKKLAGQLGKTNLYYFKESIKSAGFKVFRIYNTDYVYRKEVEAIKKSILFS